MYVFLIAAVIFALFGAIGYFTNIDLNRIGTFLLMGLFAIIICCVVNIFLNNSTFDLIISIIALLIFFGFTAYDIQKVKILSNAVDLQLMIYKKLKYLVMREWMAM